MATRRNDDHSERKTLSEIAYEQLRDRLVTLQIYPGAPIEEDQLVRDLQVGRTPVREAIKRLSHESLVVVYPRRGTFASDVNLTDLAMISDLRILLEGHAALRAAERFTKADELDLDELLTRLEAECLGGMNGMALDADIHRFIYRCARNRYLEDMLVRNFNLSLRIWHLVLDKLPDVTPNIQEHQALLNAVADHDASRAQELARRHVAAFFELIRNILSLETSIAPRWDGTGPVP